MIKLIENELIKILKRKNTYIILFLGIALILSYNIFIKVLNLSQDISKQYERAYKNDQMLLENYDNLDVKENYEDIKERLELEKYAVENNIKYNIIIGSENKNVQLEKDARILLLKFFDNFEIITIFILLYFSAIILSEEYSTGTINSLLTKPYKRSIILSSKLITLILISIVLLLFMIIFQVICGGILFGFDSYLLDAIRYNVLTSNVETMNLMQYMLMIILCKMPMYLLLMTALLLFGVITNNMALNIIISLGIYILSNMNFLINNVSKYIFVFNWDISKYLYGVGEIKNHLVISSISLLIFLIMLYLIFKNKDIKNE